MNRPGEQTFPPGPVTKSPLGHLFAFSRQPLGFLQELFARYGDVVHFRIRHRDVFLVSHPEDIAGILGTHSRLFVKNPGFQTIKRVLGEGLLSSEGEFHLRQRRLIQPAFHRQQVASYAPIMVSEVSKLSSGWQDGAEVDVFRQMVSLTLGVVSRSLFSADLDAQACGISQAVDDAMTLFHKASSPVSFFLNRLPWIGDWRFRRGRKVMDNTILGLIQQRREHPFPQDDLLSRLVGARDDGDGTRMSDEQVRDEALTILLAGHETTATGLAWTWYLLALHPEIESALHTELENILGGRSPGVEDLPRLAYTRMVLAEALRIYPPIYMMGRQALEDYPLRDYVIPAGASLIISPYIVHHDARNYPSPEQFLPRRWEAGTQAMRQKFAYLPFSAGPRVCIGEPFAWQEAMLVLAALAQRWRFTLDPNRRVEVLPRVTLRPKGGLPMRLERRA